MSAPTSPVSTAVEVVNLFDKVAQLIKSNVVVHMPQFASALPPGVDPNKAASWTGWSPKPQSLQNTVVYEPESSLFSDTKFHLGVRFNYGGREIGKPWSYVKDLEAFAILDSVTLLNELDVEVKFASTGTPIDSLHSVMLTGSFNCTQSHKVWGVEFSQFYSIKVFGNGACEIAPV